MILKTRQVKNFLPIFLVSLLVVLAGCKPQKHQEPFSDKFIEPKSNIILALYDSTENRDFEENEIKYFLEETLETKGFEHH